MDPQDLINELREKWGPECFILGLILLLVGLLVAAATGSSLGGPSLLLFLSGT